MIIVNMTMETMVQSVRLYLKAEHCPVWVHKTHEDLLLQLFPHALYVYSVCFCSNILDHCLWFASLLKLLLILLLAIEHFGFCTVSLTCPGSALNHICLASNQCLHADRQQSTNALPRPLFEHLQKYVN